MGDKVSADEKKGIEDKISALKEALKGSNLEDIKAKQEELQKDFYAISTKLYEQAQAQAQPEAGAGASQPSDNVVDADYTEVHDDDK